MGEKNKKKKHAQVSLGLLNCYKTKFNFASEVKMIITFTFVLLEKSNKHLNESALLLDELIK